MPKSPYNTTAPSQRSVQAWEMKMLFHSSRTRLGVTATTAYYGRLLVRYPSSQWALPTGSACKVKPWVYVKLKLSFLPKNRGRIQPHEYFVPAAQPCRDPDRQCAFASQLEWKP